MASSTGSIAILRSVQDITAFTQDNDPYSEHDFGSIELLGIERIFWKIDYHDLTLSGHSEDPADPM